MGQKVHPKIFRMKITENWSSRWFADKRHYADLLSQDVKIRRYITHKLRDAAVDSVTIERSKNTITININAVKPGVIIGRGGQGAEELKKNLHNRFLKTKVSRDLGMRTINLKISEVANPHLSSAAIVNAIIADIEKRIPFRRTMKQSLGRVERAGAQGAKILLSGRLNGAEIARREKMGYGKIPLHTLRANIDYDRGVAKTIFGAVGVKVWIYKGEVFEEDQIMTQEPASAPKRTNRGPVDSAGPKRFTRVNKPAPSQS